LPSPIFAFARFLLIFAQFSTGSTKKMGAGSGISEKAVLISPATGRAIPQPGEIVAVRSRHYLVEDVTLPPEPWHQTLVRLSCRDDDAQGTSIQVLWGRGSRDCRAPDLSRRA
jgi:hypothetical protein